MIRSSTAKLPRAPLTKEELRPMAAAVFHEGAAALIWIDDLRDPLERQIVTNIAERLYGRRRPPERE